MHPVLFKLGPITIYTYGFFVCLGVFAGYLIARRDSKNKGIDSALFSHVVFTTLLFSFLGAKLFYIAIEWKSFIENPLALARSGFVFYGGFISGIITLLIMAKKHRFSFLSFADSLALGLSIGHALGRIGCFYYGCCYGFTTNSRMGVLFPPDSPAGVLGVKVVPIQLISALVLLLLFFILVAIRKNQKFEGQIILFYALLYSAARFGLEFFRSDPRGFLFFLSFSQWISLLVFAAGLLLVLGIRVRLNHQKKRV